MSIVINFVLKLIFVNKNWPNDPKTLGCESFSDFVELIQMDLILEEKLEQFEELLKEMKFWIHEVIDYLKKIPKF
jgi:hypothetical protein